VATFETYDGGATVNSWSIPAVNGIYTGDISFQTFTPETTHSISSVELYIRKIADSPTVNFVSVQIQPTDGSGQPLGYGGPTALINNLFASSDIEQTAYDWKWVEFDFGGSVVLTTGVTYAIEFYYQANLGTSPIQWAKKAPDTNYPTGQIWHWKWNGVPYPGEWLDGTGEGDHYFKENGSGVPTKAKNPTPSDANSAVTLDQDTIVWEDGGGADTYNVYYGTTSGDLTLVSFIQAGLFYTVWGATSGSPYDYLAVRYWRIDSTNAAGTTTGDEWSFTTITFAPPGPNPPDPLDPDPDPPVFIPNFIRTNKRVVAAAGHQIWFEHV